MSAAMVDEATMERLRTGGDVPLSLLDSDEAKTCACGTVFYRGSHSRVDFRAQQSCSVSCGRKARDLAECPPRPCGFCEKPIPRRPGLPPRKYLLIKFCGVPCRSAKRRQVAEGKASEKTCPCGKTFRRRLNTENEARFAQRVHCSQSCGAKHRSGGPVRDETLPATKTCPVCLQEFARRASEHDARWMERVRCGRSCAAIAARQRLSRSAPKTCPQCSTVFERDYDTETSRHWARRVCCSEACTAARKAERRAARSASTPRKAKPKPLTPPKPLTVVIPPKPDTAPRPVWRPGLAVDGTGELAPGFTREVNVWAGARR